MAGYLGATPVPQATQHRESFTATSGQTTFATAGYTAGFVDVYLNGSHLSPADFTATNGSDVVLASGASADDVCDIISHSAFEVNAQTFTGTTTMDVVTATGVVTANAGVVVDNFTLDGTTLALSSGDFTVDVAGNIILDADGAEIILRDGGSNFGRFFNSGQNLFINNQTADKDITFQGVSGGADVNALTLDMSDAGTALFNHDAQITGNLLVGTTTINSKTGDGIIAFGVMGGIMSNSGTLADDGTLDIAVNTGGGGYQGFLSVANTLASNAAVRTQSTFSVFGRSTDSSIQQIATDTGASGAATFTVTTPSNGLIRVTNTQGNQCITVMQFFGGASG